MSFASTSASLPLLPSFRKQQLLLEFASLKYHCPDGIYLTPTPNDPASWNGVYFVREGPYSGAILRFELLFPPSYPEAPPLIIFSTEIFHPLLVPLTTYSIGAGVLDPNATYSASETERLPPGALTLRYKFPHWFPGAQRGRTGARTGGGTANPNAAENRLGNTYDDAGVEAENSTSDTRSKPSITIQLLNYIKTAFEDPDILDALPLEAAGNPNAWHAWRAHRGLSSRKDRAGSPMAVVSARAGTSPRSPADWNWDGVWEARVRNGIEESSNDALLFSKKNVRGGLAAGETIRFTKYDDEKLATVQADMIRMHGFTTT